MQVSLNGAEFQRIMSEAIALTATDGAGKAGKAAAGGDDNLSISTAGASGSPVAVEPTKLEEAADGGVLTDPEAVKDLVDKIEKPFVEHDLQRVNKLADDFTKCFRQELDKTKAENECPSIRDMYLCIAQITRLLLQANHALKKAAAEARNNAKLVEIDTIVSQANMEKDAALTGFFTSLCTMALQIGVSGGMKFKEISADFKADKVLANKGVLANEQIMKNTQLLGMPEAAEFDVAKCAKGMNIEPMEKIAAEVGGYSVGPDGKLSPSAVDTGVAGARADLENMVKQRNDVQNAKIEKVVEGEKTTYRYDNCNFDTEENANAAKNDAIKKLDAKIVAGKADLVKAADGKVNEIRANRNLAEIELSTAKEELAEAKEKAKWTRPGSEERKAVAELEGKVDGCQKKLDNLNRDLVYANAVRTNLFSQGVAGEPLLSQQECKMRQGAAKSAYNESLEMATNSIEYKLVQQDSKKWAMIDKCSEYVCGMLGQLPQSITSIMRANAERHGAERVRAEAEYSSANDMVQLIAQNQAKTIEMCRAFFDSWLQSMRNAVV